MTMSEPKGKKRMMDAGITPSQCRAARAAIGWEQRELAERAAVSRTTLVSFEKGTSIPHVNNLAAMRRAFEAAGVVFEIDPETGRIGLTYLDVES